MPADQHVNRREKETRSLGSLAVAERLCATVPTEYQQSVRSSKRSIWSGFAHGPSPTVLFCVANGHCWPGSVASALMLRSPPTFSRRMNTVGLH